MRLLLPLFFLAALIDCNRPEEEIVEPRRVENPSFAIALADIPAGFEVEANGDGQLSLVIVDQERGGRAWFEVEPESEVGINIVEVVKAQKPAFESLPGSTFFGSRELQMGTGRVAYYTRGRFEDGGAEVEEFRIDTLHPTQNRHLKVYYRYPAADDSDERLEDVLFLLSEIEALDGAFPDTRTEATE